MPFLIFFAKWVKLPGVKTLGLHLFFVLFTFYLTICLIIMARSKEIKKCCKLLLFEVFDYFLAVSKGEVEPIQVGESKSQLITRVANLSKFSKSTIFNVIRVGSSATDLNTAFQPTVRKPRSDKKSVLEDSQLDAIRQMIYGFHTSEGRLVTLKHLSAKIEKELEIKLSSFTLRKVLNQLGFKFVKTQNNRVQLIEKPDIVARRKIFLEKMAQFRREQRNIIYLDETYVHTNYSTVKAWQDSSSHGFHPNIGRGTRFIVVHAGSKDGFVQNAFLCFKSGTTVDDYHGEMNATNFTTWVQQQLLPNLPENCVIVVDNASYHNVYDNPPPRASNRKAEILKWLIEKVLMFV